jgi:hypothetical protein
MRFLLACVIVFMGAQSTGVALSQEPGGEMTLDPETKMTLDPEYSGGPATGTVEGMDADVDTGTNASGAVDVDVSSMADADTDASGIDDETGIYVDDETGSLPDAASELPLIGLIGLLCLSAALGLRLILRRREQHG